MTSPSEKKSAFLQGHEYGIAFQTCASCLDPCVPQWKARIWQLNSNGRQIDAMSLSLVIVEALVVEPVSSRWSIFEGDDRAIDEPYSHQPEQTTSSPKQSSPELPSLGCNRPRNIAVQSV